MEKLHNGDCVEVMAGMAPNSVDAIICDPPYGLAFMGKAFDTLGDGPAQQAWHMRWLVVAYRVLKPGGYLLAFGGTRTYHRLACAVEDAGFEIRDSIASLHWVHAQGFPKSLDISKAIDCMDRTEAADIRARRFTAWMRSTGITAKQINEATDSFMGSHYLTDKSQPHVATTDLFDKLRPLLPPVPDEIEELVRSRTVESENLKRRAVLGLRKGSMAPGFASELYGNDNSTHEIPITEAYTDVAREWSGWGTALKPAHEPIVVARKPFAGTVADNVLKYGTGGLNVDGCRLGADRSPDTGSGRWPPNVLLHHLPGCGEECAPRCVVQELDGQSRCDDTSGASRMFPQFGHAGEADDPYLVAVGFGYHAKPSTDERDNGTASLARGRQDPSRDPDSAGANDPRNRGGTLRGNVHPTVKPISAMRWLCRLVCRRGGTVLDPFLGSGTTGIAALQEDMNFVGIEREPEYFAIAQARIKWWAGRHQLSMF